MTPDELLEQLTEEQLKELVGTMLFAGIKMMVARDIPPAKALRAVSVEYLQAAFGTDVWKELGLPERTVRRWRSELREALASGPEIEDEPPADVLASFERLQRPAEK